MEQSASPMYVMWHGIGCSRLYGSLGRRNMASIDIRVRSQRKASSMICIGCSATGPPHQNPARGVPGTAALRQPTHGSRSRRCIWEPGEHIIACEAPEPTQTKWPLHPACSSCTYSETMRRKIERFVSETATLSPGHMMASSCQHIIIARRHDDKPLDAQNNRRASLAASSDIDFELVNFLWMIQPV
eukprot:scaffold321739_cov25-Prasinocladus_malaysianus.AAC.1